MLSEVSRDYQVSEDVFGNMLVSLTEAVTNAIVHGNNSDVSKSVKIQLEKAGNNFIIRVSDEGPGFDPNSLPDPTRGENLYKTGGRGVFLMQKLSDTMCFHNNGSTVEMLFKL
jgi:serine/threonine-protein kinase RsbW